MQTEFNLTRWITPDRAALVLSWVRILFLLLAADVLRRLVVSRGRPAARGGRAAGRPAFRLLFAGFCLLFAGVYAYQATWQLTGFARPRFVEFMRRYNRRPENPAENLARGLILDRQGRCLAGNDTNSVRQRVYPLGPAACHVVGYADPVYGLDGIEAAAQAHLSGASVSSAAEIDRFGRNVLDHRAIRGHDLRLTLSAPLQEAAARRLAGRRGAVVVLCPTNGAVLALASSPGFDPNRLDAALFAGRRPDAPLLNRALQGAYPPGSAFKIVVAALALENGFSGRLDCPAEGVAAERGAQPIRDHEYYEHQRRRAAWPGHGRIGIDTALARSSNVFFAQLGLRYGGPRLAEAARRFLIGAPLSIRCGPAAALAAQPGALPSLRDGQRREAAQLAIGQGRLLVTPLHLAVIAAAVANDGVAMRPTLTEAEPAEPLATCTSPAVARRLRALLRDAVQRGTGRGADVPGLDVAGKTGTAQTPSGDDHSWFICMAPAERPAVAMAVLVENGGYGAESAVPIAAALLRQAREDGLTAR